MQLIIEFQSYLRSDSDMIVGVILFYILHDFNPTLGLILTFNTATASSPWLSFQSYLRSDSDPW